MRSPQVVKVSKPRTPFMVAVPASTTGTKTRSDDTSLIKRRRSPTSSALKREGFLGAEGQGGKSTAGGSKVTVAECAALWIARHQQARMTFF